MHIFSGTVQYNFVWFEFLKIALFRDFPGCTSFAIVRFASRLWTFYLTILFETLGIQSVVLLKYSVLHHFILSLWGFLTLQLNN